MSGRAEYDRQAATPDGDDLQAPGKGAPEHAEAERVAAGSQGTEPEPAAEADGPADAAERHGEGGGSADAGAEASADADGDAAEDTGPTAAEQLAAATDPVALAEALIEAQQERDRYLDHLRRERAEFENFRKRANRERMEAVDRGAENLISQMLGVLEDFDRVLDAAEKSEDTQLAKGVAMVQASLRGVLDEAGLAEVPGAGALFDPNVHEAMMQVEPDEPVEQPVVAEVLRRGYQFKGRVLRPAAVSVAQ
jgi:molecular chaperone GrpE